MCGILEVMSVKSKFSENPWLKLNFLGFLGGFTGAFISVFFLDFFNPLNLMVPPYKAFVWAWTSGILGFSVVNSILISERFKRGFLISGVLFLIFFVIHSIIFKPIIPGVGKLFEVSGFGLGFGILYGRNFFKTGYFRLSKGFIITMICFILSFVFIGLRYFIGSNFFFREPIDLEIWFSWTLMCTWIAFMIGFEEYILKNPKA